MPFANNNGVRIYWRLQGGDALPVLVLLSGIGTEQGLYDRAAPFLLDEFRLLRVDNRGHGASDAPAGDYDLGTLASDVRVAMDAAGVREAVICGTSLGAMIAMALALDAPQRIRGLVLACTSARMDASFWSQRITVVRANGMPAVAEIAVSRLLSDEFARLNPGIVHTLRRELLTMSRDGYAGCAAAIRDMDLIPRIRSIAAPTVVITASFDLATPAAGHGDLIVATIPGAQSIVLNSGHLACVELPEAFAEATIEFVRRSGTVGQGGSA
jgi:3-oxoadipate enol-lactonase/4-carboxymuconolactone decarboxylase